MEFRQLRSFVSVIKKGSFSAAAECLMVSQPTISTHIRMLEEELGTSLLIRSTRSVRATAKGEELLRTGEQILNLHDNLMRRWQEDSSRIIRLGVSTIPAAYILPQLFQGFRADYPEIVFSIEQGDSKSIEESVLFGRSDIGLIGVETSERELECIPFCADDLVLVTPNEEAFRDIPSGTEGIHELLRMPFILRESGSGSQMTADMIIREYGFAPENLNVVARMSDPDSIRKLIAAGLGVSILSSRSVYEDVLRGTVLSFGLDVAEARRNLCFIRRKDAPVQRAVRLFTDYLLKTQ